MISWQGTEECNMKSESTCNWLINEQTARPAFLFIIYMKLSPRRFLMHWVEWSPQGSNPKWDSSIHFLWFTNICSKSKCSLCPCFRRHCHNLLSLAEKVIFAQYYSHGFMTDNIITRAILSASLKRNEFSPPIGGPSNTKRFSKIGPAAHVWWRDRGK